MNEIQLTYSWAWLLLIAPAAFVFTYFLYRATPPWSALTNRILFVMRFVLLLLLAFLLLHPFVRQVTRFYEPPVIVLGIDNSTSVTLSADTVALRTALQALAQLRQRAEESGYEVHTRYLSGAADSLAFTHQGSDLSKFLIGL